MIEEGNHMLPIVSPKGNVIKVTDFNV